MDFILLWPNGLIVLFIVLRPQSCVGGDERKREREKERKREREKERKREREKERKRERERMEKEKKGIEM